jgi:hypothetical protein
MLAKGLHVDLKRPPTPFSGRQILQIQEAREPLRSKFKYAITGRPNDSDEDQIPADEKDIRGESHRCRKLLDS